MKLFLRVLNFFFLKGLNKEPPLAVLAVLKASPQEESHCHDNYM